MRPLVVAIHGAAANAATWIPLQRLLDDAVELIAADLPAHGTRRAEDFNFEAACAEVQARIAAEPPDRTIVLAGDSLGGYIALAIAARMPGRFAGVVAGSCTFPMRGVEALLARASLLADIAQHEALFALLARRLCTPDVADAIIARGFAPRQRGITLRALLGRDALADVASIATPVVFVVGEFDVPLVWYAARFARHARDGRTIVVPRAGHGVGLTHPASFVAAIDGCLANTTASNGTWVSLRSL